MLALVAAAVVAAPAPRALPSASAAVYVPRLDKLSDVIWWMEIAGARSVLLRPDSWKSEFHPFLAVDPTRGESLASVGMDPAGAATVSYVGNVRVSCTTLKDAKRFVEKAQERLKNLGESYSAKADGATIVGAKVLDRVLAGYALKGNEACSAATQGESAEQALTQAAKLLSKPSTGGVWKAVSSLRGAAFVVTSYGAAGLRGKGNALTADGRTTRLPLPKLAGAGPSPYGGMTPSGMLFARARVSASEAASLVRAVTAQLRTVCHSCDGAQVRALADALGRELTGHVVVRADSVKVREPLKTPAGRFFAVKHAYAAEVVDGERARTLLDQLEKWPMARPSGSGFALSVNGGVMHVGVKDKHLYIGNDTGAVQALLDAIPASPAKMAHGAELTVDPKLVAKGLSQVSLLDVVASQELAGIFAAATELGPLLAASERITAWADSNADGTHAWQAVWTLAGTAR